MHSSRREQSPAQDLERRVREVINRREFLVAAGAAGSVTALTGCSGAIRSILGSRLPETIEPPTARCLPAYRLLNRIGFGPTPGQPALVADLGHEQYIREQLEANRKEDAALLAQIGRLDAFMMESSELRDLPEGELIRQLQQAALLRATYSPNQLQERMVEFWTDHFNIYGRKAYAAWRKPKDELTVVRSNALGKFPEMLMASAKSPAMLEYLDNQVNEKGAANENYAREILELHSLGVDGGYTQRDVQEVARCFTGWTIENRFGRPRGRFRFDESLHDPGEKSVLGHRIPAGGGVEDGETVIHILSLHPSTARHISKKLCQKFIGEAPERLVAACCDRFLASQGDIRETLRPILFSPLLIESPPILKRPFDFVVSALRALGAATDGGPGVNRHLEAMGQPMYEWPMPDGYPVAAEAWTGSLLARWNFALALCSGSISGTSAPIQQLKERSDSIAEFVLGLVEIPQGVRESISSPDLEIHEVTALCLASGEFQWR